MTNQGWPGNQPSGNGFPADGSTGNQPGDQYGSLFGQGHSGQPSFDQPQFGQPSFEQPPYGQPTFEQPQFGQPSFEQPQFGQPSFEQTQYGQPQQFGQPSYGQASYGQASYGQAPGGWNGQTPGGFGGQPPKKNWLLFGGIGAGVIIVVLVVALVLQGLNKGGDNEGGDTSPPATTPATPSGAPTDSDGIPVIPVNLTGKSVPEKVGNYELATGLDRTYDDSTSMIYRDPSAQTAITVLGSFTNGNLARSVARGLQDPQRIGDFICGKSPSSELHYCAARTSDGSIYFFSRPEITPAALGELANGVVTGSQ